MTMTTLMPTETTTSMSTLTRYATSKLLCKLSAGVRDDVNNLLSCSITTMTMPTPTPNSDEHVNEVSD